MSFKAVQAKIAKRSGEPMANAGAMLAAATRRASPAAKAKNPALKKVKMPNMAMGGKWAARKGQS